MSHHPEEVAAPVPTRGRRLALVREAVRGSESIDYTEGPIGRALLLLAIPMVLETVLESVFAVVDVFWVSRLGAEAVTAVGLTEAYLNLVYTVAIGLSIGATAMVARRIGERDPEGAARAAMGSLVLGLVVAGTISVAGAVYAAELLGLMGGAPEVVRGGTGYIRIMLAGNATVVLLFVLNAVFRGAGDAVIAMRVLWLANGINIVLDPLLIFGWGPFPELGLEGAAVATNLGRGLGVVVQLWTLARPAGRVRILRRHLAVDLSVLWRLVRLSGTGTFQIFVGTASWVFLTRILADFGTPVVAGYTIALRVIIFALLPLWGLSNAAATIVGQSLGAGRPERAERSVRLAGLWSAAVMTGVALAFFTFAPAIVAAFTSDPGPMRWGIACLRIVSIGFPLYGIGMVYTQAFNGAGDARTPTWINLGCFWAFEIPAAYLLSRMGMGPSGVFVAVAIAYGAVPMVAWPLFSRGGWKSTNV